jgi:hypothetical protein
MGPPAPGSLGIAGAPVCGNLPPLLKWPLLKFERIYRFFQIMPSWLESSWFEYPLTRPVTLRHFNIYVLVLGLIYAIIITFLNIIVAGYESVAITSSNYNGSYSLWYERIFPMTPLLPTPWNCNATSITVNDGTTFLSRSYQT